MVETIYRPFGTSFTLYYGQIQEAKKIPWPPLDKTLRGEEAHTNKQLSKSPYLGYFFFKTKRFCISFNKSYPSTIASLWHCIVDIQPQMNNPKKQEKNK